MFTDDDVVATVVLILVIFVESVVIEGPVIFEFGWIVLLTASVLGLIVAFPLGHIVAFPLGHMVVFEGFVLGWAVVFNQLGCKILQLSFLQQW